MLNRRGYAAPIYFAFNFTENSPFIAKPIRKAPNSFFKTTAGRSTAISPPATEVNTAGMITLHTPSVFNSPRSWCAFKENAAMGRKAIKLVACAICCSTPKITVRAGINMVPPPIPIPPSIPDKKPATRYKIKLISTFLLLQPALRQ